MGEIISHILIFIHSFISGCIFLWGGRDSGCFLLIYWEIWGTIISQFQLWMMWGVWCGDVMFGYVEMDLKGGDGGVWWTSVELTSHTHITTTHNPHLDFKRWWRRWVVLWCWVIFIIIFFISGVFNTTSCHHLLHKVTWCEILQEEVEEVAETQEIQGLLISLNELTLYYFVVRI